jgi:CRISPR/Cas system-associated exonuclease Cas4 (RecB family)
LSIVDQYLVSQPGKSRLPGVYYVTDLTKPCLRQAYLDVVSPGKFDVGTLRIFEAGRLIEGWWVDVLSKSPGFMVLGTQLMARWRGDWGAIHGRVDALVQHDGGALFVHEVKSIKSLAYMNGAAKPEHIQQIQFYLGCLNLEFGSVDYISKENLLQGLGVVEQCYQLRRDPAAFVYMVKRGEELAGYVDRVEVPEMSKGWQCDYCLHRGNCK